MVGLNVSRHHIESTVSESIKERETTPKRRRRKMLLPSKNRREKNTAGFDNNRFVIFSQIYKRRAL